MREQLRASMESTAPPMSGTSVQPYLALQKPLRLQSLLVFVLLATTPCTAGPQVAFTLFDSVRDRPGVAFAPNALEDTLSLLYFGSAGETETAFQSVLFPSLSREDAMAQAGQRKRTFPGYRSIGGLGPMGRTRDRSPLDHICIE